MKGLISKCLGVFFVLFFSLAIHAQSDPKLTNYIFTPLTFNPAYAGSFEGYSASALYTSQWVGFDGAPETLYLSAHSKIGDSNVGLGLDVLSDRVGATKENRALANFAYHLRLNNTWRLSSGIKVGYSNYAIDYRQLSIENPQEFNPSLGDVSNHSFVFGAGFYLHTEKFFIGVSVPNFLTTQYVDEFRNTLASSTPNLFGNIGYQFELERDVILQPTALVRLVEGAPISTLYSLNFNWQEQFYANVNFEYDVSIGGFVGVRISDQFMAGYAYDATMGRYSRFNGGIHSLVLTLRAKERYRRGRCGCYTY